MGWQLHKLHERRRVSNSYLSAWCRCIPTVTPVACEESERSRQRSRATYTMVKVAALIDSTTETLAVLAALLTAEAPLAEPEAGC